ncbi:MAG: KUP/HAK/KT family potassium transporter [Myxococcota bacterium]
MQSPPEPRNAGSDPPTDEDFERSHGRTRPGPNAHLTERWLALAIGAAGVVYGDIGTSPLYTWSEVRHSGAVSTSSDIVGACSLIFWTLTLIAFGKYIAIALRADNNGEGGTFALLSQIRSFGGRSAAVVGVVLVFASALLYGDALITPAISVLSAVEGIAVADERLEWLVVPATIVIITGLFMVQYHGTHRVGRLFGSVMVLWFAVIAAFGLIAIVRDPEILAALSPLQALSFLFTRGLAGDVAVLGSVVLCITGGEALFADMGHFGPVPIRRAWVALVYPALVLSYFGQGAFLLSGAPIEKGNVFFSMVPGPLQVPMVILATCATIIASQALISGAFSLTRSAINLGLLPRVSIVHTNREIEGQIYMPAVNWGLWFGCCWLVLEFHHASNLAAAYGLAVTGTMTATTVALAFVARRRWRWPLAPTVVVFGTFGTIELAYLGANVVKIASGAWVPLVIAILLFVTMQVWRTGRLKLGAAYAKVDRFTVRQLVELKRRMPELTRAMVFLTQERVQDFDDPVPIVLLKFVDRYGAVPKHLTLFSVVQEPMPYWREKRFDVRQFGDNVTSVRMHVGYMESPNTRAALVHLKQQRQVRIHATRWTIVMGREELVVEPGGWWWRLPYLLFGLLQTVGGEAHVWFGLGGDTGISKEVVPVRVGKSGVMEVVVRPPELDPSWLQPAPADDATAEKTAESPLAGPTAATPMAKPVEP